MRATYEERLHDEEDDGASASGEEVSRGTFSIELNQAYRMYPNCSDQQQESVKIVFLRASTENVPQESTSLPNEQKRCQAQPVVSQSIDDS